MRRFVQLKEGVFNMSNLTFVPVKDPEQIAELANLAEDIYREYYSDVLEPNKLEALIKYALSAGVLIGKIADYGYEYYFVNLGEKHIGYVGIAPDDGFMLLSEVYLEKSMRGHGYMSKAFDFIQERAHALGFKKIRVQCSKKNFRALDIYDHVGFRKIGRKITDIGDGFEKNDFVLELAL